MLGRGQGDCSSAGEFFFEEPTVSRVHAKLVWNEMEKAYDLVHLSQTNHTLVNNQVVPHRHCLQVGDHIRLGKLVLEVQKAPVMGQANAGGLKLDVVSAVQNQAPLGRKLSQGLPDNLVGRRLGPYVLGKELGRGAVGRVYIAQHVAKDFTCAIKILAPEATQDATFLKRFQTEARVASGLVHPNIIRVLDINHQDGLVYLAMEFGGRKNLQAVLDETKGPLPVPRTLRILEQLLLALEHAHSQGVIHRDVKPANVLVNEPNDHLALTDFSIAKVKDDIRVTSVGVVLGTIEYMAPELFDGQIADCRADLYAVGVILYEMLTGVLPFKGRTNAEVIRAQLLQFPPDPRSINPQAPDSLVQLAFVALQKEPENRYPTATAMLQALHTFTR